MSIDLRKRIAELTALEDELKLDKVHPEWKKEYSIHPDETPWWEITEPVERQRVRNRQTFRVYRKTHPKQYAASRSRYSRKVVIKVKLSVIALFGGKCSKCGETDWRVLQVNHVDGRGKADREKYSKRNNGFYRAILDGKRSTEGLTLLCANCNVLFEYETGRRE